MSDVCKCIQNNISGEISRKMCAVHGGRLAGKSQGAASASEPPEVRDAPSAPIVQAQPSEAAIEKAAEALGPDYWCDEHPDVYCWCEKKRTARAALVAALPTLVADLREQLMAELREFLPEWGYPPHVVAAICLELKDRGDR